MRIPERFFEIIPNGRGESRVGGAMPAVLASDAEFADGRYFFMTLSCTDFPVLGSRDVSIFLDETFAPFDEETGYPEIRVYCARHLPSGPDPTGRGVMRDIPRGSLSLIERGDEPCFVKFGGQPMLLQVDDRYERPVKEAGYAFLFQVDESGFPDGFVEGDYPLGYGALYVYATFDAHGQVSEVVPGFSQF
ncbi:hypothetical protein [Clavibacter sp. Sh2126]|uniref:hypothetical protein n=1 Tax=Clavibacter sp. Sh2126 TaxID=3397678 RepID=UPI0039E16359